MAQIGEVSNTSNDNTTPVTISYLTEEVKRILGWLPPFLRVTQWTKTLKGVLADFTFMNLLIYSSDKHFDMDSIKAFELLKVYKYFHDGYVKNLWLYQCPISAESNLRVLFFEISYTTLLPQMPHLKYLLG